MSSVERENLKNNTNSTSCVVAEPPEVIMLIIGSFALLLNVLLILVLYHERKKFFRTRVSYLVANLSLADGFTGIGLVLVMVLHMVQRQELLKGLQFYILCITIQASFLTIILMSLDRLVVAAFPMTWSRFLTIRRTVVGIVVTWVISIFGGVMLHHYIHKKRLALLLFLEISVVLFILIHVVIFQCLKRYRRQLTNSNSSAELSTVVDLTLQASHAQITSVALTSMLVVVVTYIPYIIFLNILMATKGTNMQIALGSLPGRYTRAFSYLNYAANPIVYAWRLRVYRKAFCQMFKLV